MDRRDILWVAIKLAGLYPITQGVIWIPDAIVEGGLINQLDAGVPILAGLLLLGIRVSGGGGGVLMPSLRNSMSRHDWFWLVSKSLGLWWAVHAVLQVPMTIQLSATVSTNWVMLLAVGVYLAAGLILLFTNSLPRMVARFDRVDVVAPSVHDAAQHGAAADDRPQAGDRS